MRNKLCGVFFAIYFAAAVFLCAQEAGAMTVSGKSGRYFVVKTPKAATVGGSFKTVIKVYDENDRLIHDYNKTGNDVELSTSGDGVLQPDFIPAESFRHGKVVVDLTYDKAESFDIIVTPIEREPSKDSYIVGVGDALEISVWEAEGLTKDVIVAPDGTIAFPLIGQVKAAGQSLEDLNAEITEKMSEFVKEPQVSIDVKKVAGKRVVVFGEVTSPGVYFVSGEGTVMEAVAMAKGFTKDAVTGTVVVIRGDPSVNPDVRVLNLVKAVKRGDLSKEYFINPNDIIYVPERLIPSPQYLIKQVLPGLLKSMAEEAVINQWLKDSIYVPDPDRASSVTVD
ncbi:MAG: polysaccharide biosynthesis/export family protein [Candidatus Omnitrophota bacterium]